MCIICREKNETNELQFDNVCFYHNVSCSQYRNEKEKESELLDNNSSTIIDNESLSKFIPDYVEIQWCINVMEYVFVSYFNESYTGYRLLNRRVNKQKENALFTTNEKKSSEKRKQWKSLLNDSLTRTNVRKKEIISSNIQNKRKITINNSNIAVSLFDTSNYESFSSQSTNKRKRPWHL